jgi:ribulose-phosphate 3-epimerase
MVKISASIIASDFTNLRKVIKKLEMANVDFIHFDVMDGVFVPNITIGPYVISSLKKITKIPFDVHLMIQDPTRYISSFKEAGADIISIHIEACPHIIRTIKMMKNMNIKVGVALNPATSLNSIEYILENVDIVVIMSVEPGFYGQEFMPEVLPKIRNLKKMMKNKKINAIIEVDGGINKNNISKVIKAGADIVVAGASIFGEKDIILAVKSLRKYGCN